MGNNEKVLRGEFILLSAFKKTLESPYSCNLTTHLKPLDKKEAKAHKKS